MTVSFNAIPTLTPAGADEKAAAAILDLFAHAEAIVAEAEATAKARHRAGQIGVTSVHDYGVAYWPACCREPLSDDCRPAYYTYTLDGESDCNREALIVAVMEMEMGE